jgi:hypothetical protein
VCTGALVCVEDIVAATPESKRLWCAFLILKAKAVGKLRQAGCFNALCHDGAGELPHEIPLPFKSTVETTGMFEFHSEPCV